MIGYSDAFIEKPAGILTKVEYQTLQVALAQPLEILLHLTAGGFREAQNLEIRHAGLDPEGVLHALALDLVTHYVKRQVVRSAFPRDHDLHRGAARTLEQIG